MTDAGDTDFSDELFAIEFGVAKSMRYHAYRRAFFMSCDRWSKVLSAISGAGALVAFTGDKDSGLAKFLAFAVAILGSADLVVGFNERARVHDELYRRFSNLLQEIIDAEPKTKTEINSLRRRRVEIEADEPTIMDWLERRCSAEECVSRGCELREAWKLTGFQIFLSQIAIWPSWSTPKFDGSGE